MSNTYATKTVLIKHRGKPVERVVAADLDRVYLTDRDGNIIVYYSTNEVVDDKHLFRAGNRDKVVKKAIELKGRVYG